MIILGHTLCKIRDKEEKKEEKDTQTHMLNTQKIKKLKMKQHK